MDYNFFEMNEKFCNSSLGGDNLEDLNLLLLNTQLPFSVMKNLCLTLWWCVMNSKLVQRRCRESADLSEQKIEIDQIEKIFYKYHQNWQKYLVPLASKKRREERKVMFEIISRPRGCLFMI